ncbi:hypothetical protein [Chamaesiphon sp. VAR_48_metabat_403]|nr:hypothetical protein [Chamaesiphon sp. VAR_48_metabat_403]
MPMVWQIDRDIQTLIEQGCQWLKQEYIQSHPLDAKKAKCLLVN